MNDIFVRFEDDPNDDFQKVNEKDTRYQVDKNNLEGMISQLLNRYQLPPQLRQPSLKTINATSLFPPGLVEIIETYLPKIKLVVKRFSPNYGGFCYYEPFYLLPSLYATYLFLKNDLEVGWYMTFQWPQNLPPRPPKVKVEVGLFIHKSITFTADNESKEKCLIYKFENVNFSLT